MDNGFSHLTPSFFRTDSPCDVTHSPSPSEKDIQFILREVDDYLSQDVTVRRADVQSAWTGIRPLVKVSTRRACIIFSSAPIYSHDIFPQDPRAEDTQSLVRNHVVHVSETSGLITIAGGKWTTYR